MTNRYNMKLWRAVSAMVVLGAGLPAGAIAADCSIKQLASLDMVPTTRNDVVIPVTVNGAPEKFLVDTGGVVTTIFAGPATALGLSPTRGMAPGAAVYDTGGTRYDRLVEISQFGLGDLKASALPFLWQPGGRSDREIDGVLAPDLLRNYDVDIDFAGGKMKLFSQDHCAGKVVYWTKFFDAIPAHVRGGGHLEIAVLLDGESVRAAVDTGAEATTLSDSAAKRLFHLDASAAGVEKLGGTETGATVHYRYRFKSLSFGAIAVTNPLFNLLPDAAQHNANFDSWKTSNDLSQRPDVESPEMLLGMDILRKLHFYIAYKEQKLYLSAAGAPPLLTR